MTARRMISVLSVCLAISATAVIAGPKAGKKAPAKTPAPAKEPAAPAKEPAPAPAPAAGSGSGSAGDAGGSAVQMTEDPPPSDMEGTNENPDAPKTPGQGSAAPVVVAPKVKKSGYPMEEALRPITLPQNMSEVSIEAHTNVYPIGATSLRARYGITRQVQLGLTYVLGGLFDDPKTLTTDKVGFHPGKAVGLDVTVLLQDWLAVRVGVPVYIDPVAVGLQIGAPLKFVFGDGKLALGGMDDLLNIKLHKFAPSFYSEAANAGNAAASTSSTIESNGTLRFSGYGVYQQKPNMAIIGRFGVDINLGDSGAGGPGASSSSSAITFIRAGLEFTVRKSFDAGVSLGFDDLSHAKSFGPAGYLAVRI